MEPQPLPQRLHVSLAVDPDRLGEVRRNATAAGLAVEDELGEVGVLTGSVEAGSLPALRDLDGVDAVEVDRQVMLPPPDAPVQ